MRLGARLASTKLTLLPRSSTTSRTPDGEYLFWEEFFFHGVCLSSCVAAAIPASSSAFLGLGCLLPAALRLRVTHAFFAAALRSLVIKPPRYNALFRHY